MSNQKFNTFGTFKNDCREIHIHFCEMESLRQQGKQWHDEWIKARDDKEAAQKALANAIESKTQEFWRGELSIYLANSAKMGLRFPHISGAFLNSSRDNHRIADGVASFLYKNGICEITIGASYSSIVETLAGFFENGWQVVGLHNLPERYHEYYGNYGGSEKVIHLVRPTFATPCEDWED